MSVSDIEKTLRIEELILENLSNTVGYDHPAWQSSIERIASLKTILHSMND